MAKGKNIEKVKSKGYIRKIFEKFLWSFDNSSSGFSARKLSAFIAVCVAIYVTTKVILLHDNDIHDNILYIIGIWLIFALMCLGIITAEQLIRFKDGVDKNVEDDHDDIEIEAEKPSDKPADKPKDDCNKPKDESADPVI